MIDESITIVLPLPAKVLSPNYTIGSIGGRMAVSAARKKSRKMTREAIEAEGITTMPWECADVKATFFWKTKGRHDIDNAIGSMKSICDGIVESGLIPDDDPKHMKRNIPEFKVDKTNPCVIVEITRLS